MKKNIYLIIMALLPFALFGQIKFGVQGGVTVSKAEFTNDMSTLNLGHKPGPLAGVMAGMNLGATPFSIMQEINYVAKGARITGTDTYAGNEVEVKGSQTTHYIEAPLSFLFYFNLGKGHFFAGMGPYGAIGLKGRNKLTYQLYRITEVEESNISYGTQVDQLKPLDFGVHASLGYKLFYGSYLKAFYSHGMADLSNTSLATYRNRYFGVSFGYFFASGKK